MNSSPERVCVRNPPTPPQSFTHSETLCVREGLPHTERFTLTIVAEPDRPGRVRVPVEQRLRQWLKLGLRGFRLRCVSVTSAPTTTTPSQPTDAAADNVGETT